MIEKSISEKYADIAMIRPDGPIRDDVDRLSRFLEIEDLARIEISQLERQAAYLESRLHVINMAREMLESKFPLKHTR